MYRFRLISAAMTYGLEVSIDNHQLHVIATDGSHVTKTTVDSLIVFSGERYDFWVNASDIRDLGRYWIRVKSLERKQNGKVGGLSWRTQQGEGV